MCKIYTFSYFILASPVFFKKMVVKSYSRIRRHHQQLQKEQEDDLLEGEELKRLKAQHIIEKQKLEEIRKKEAVKMMGENLRQIDDVKRTKQIQQLQEEVRVLFSCVQNVFSSMIAQRDDSLENKTASQ